MKYILKSCHGFDLFPIESKLFMNRTIFIEGEIKSETACEFLRKIMLLVSEAPDRPINILINLLGGEINAGLLIYDTIQTCPTSIKMFCVGRAYSMAAILVACGNHGGYIFPNSELMLHESIVKNQTSGNNSFISFVNYIFNVEENVKFGLIDEIIAFDKIMEG